MRRFTLTLLATMLSASLAMTMVPVAIAGGPSDLVATLDGVVIPMTQVPEHHCHLAALPEVRCFADADDRDSDMNSVLNESSSLSLLPTTIARLWSGINYAGSSLATNISIADLRTYGWDNITSSLEVQSGHSVSLYVGYNYGGSGITRTASVANLGSYGFDNCVSSVKINY